MIIHILPPTHVLFLINYFVYVLEFCFSFLDILRLSGREITNGYLNREKFYRFLETITITSRVTYSVSQNQIKPKSK